MSKDFQETMYICKKCYGPMSSSYLSSSPCGKCGGKRKIELKFSSTKGWLEYKRQKKQELTLDQHIELYSKYQQIINKEV